MNYYFCLSSFSKTIFFLLKLNGGLQWIESDNWSYECGTDADAGVLLASK